MGFMERVLGGNSDSPEQFAEAEFDDKQQTEETAEHTIYTVEVSGSADILTIKDHLHEGNVVFVEIQSNAQQSAEQYVSDLQQTVEQIGGDIAYRTDEEIIAAPQGFFISRKRQ